LFLAVRTIKLRLQKT